jgi:hypothetical protein
VSRVSRRGWGSLVVRGLLIAVGASIVAVSTLVLWPLLPGRSESADDRRIADLQRLTHAIEIYRVQHDVLPATLVKLPPDPAAPIHTFDPITNRPYDYRPLGPLAYEVCARFDAALADEPRDFWWHDAGRQCFALEMRDTRPKPVLAAEEPTPADTPPSGEPSPAPTPAPAAEPGAPPAAPAPEGAGAPVTPPGS